MSSDSPAAILFDELGNPVGVEFDGVLYRLQVDSRITDGISIVGITNIAPGINALKVDVVKTVSGGGVGVGGTSSNFAAPFPDAGTAVGYFDGYYMQSAKVFDLNTLIGGTEFVLGTNLRTYADGGSVEAGTLINPLRIDVTGTTIQPVSGTVIANAGSGTFNIAGTVIANQGTSPWIVQVDGYVQTNPDVFVTNFPTSYLVTQGISPWVNNITQFGGVNISTGTGTSGTGIPRVTVSSDSNILATQSGSWTVTVNQGTNPWIEDVNDRAGRLLGIIYGSQGQQLKQTATNFNTQVEIAVGGTLIDPRVIRALTSADVVTANAGTGTFAVSGTVTANAGTGNFTVTQATAGNLNATVVGTVTANIGTTNGLALDTSVNGILVGQNSTTSGQFGPLIQGAVTTSAPSYTTAKTSPLSLTTGGLLRIDGSGVTQPVSGTVTANAGSGTFTVSGTVASTQSGTWTVQPGNTANTTPWLATINQGGNSVTVSAGGALKVDGSAVTQPVSGTVTSNIGTTGGLALDTSVNGILLSQGSTTSGQKGNLIQGSVTTAAPSYTTAQTSPLSLTTSGLLRVDGSGVTQPVSGTITANAGSGTFTVSGTVTANIGTTNGLALDTSVNGVIVSQGAATAGERGPLIQGAVTTSAPSYIASQTFPLSLTTTGLLRIDGSGVTQPISGTVTANVGTTNGLALDSSVNGILVTQGSTTSGESGPLIQGAVTTSAPSYTTAKTSPLSLTTTGALRVDSSAATQPVQEVRSSSAAETSVAASASSVVLLASNVNRLGATFWNDSTTATLYLKLGATASTTSYTAQLFPSGYYELPYGYTGEIDGIWSAAVGNARISELT